MKKKRLPLPDDDIHDQEVPHQANDTDDQVHHHHGDLDTRGQQSLRLIVASIEVVLENGVVVELQVAQLGQQEVLREGHRNGAQLARGDRKRWSQELRRMQDCTEEYCPL